MVAASGPGPGLRRGRQGHPATDTPPRAWGLQPHCVCCPLLSEGGRRQNRAEGTDRTSICTCLLGSCPPLNTDDGNVCAHGGQDRPGGPPVKTQ